MKNDWMGKTCSIKEKEFGWITIFNIKTFKEGMYLEDLRVNEKVILKIDIRTEWKVVDTAVLAQDKGL
jgi:hypothetical protein